MDEAVIGRLKEVHANNLLGEDEGAGALGVVRP
jgi:hypothetical protein